MYKLFVIFMFAIVSTILSYKKIIDVNMPTIVTVVLTMLIVFFINNNTIENFSQSTTAAANIKNIKNASLTVRKATVLSDIIVNGSADMNGETKFGKWKFTPNNLMCEPENVGLKYSGAEIRVVDAANNLLGFGSSMFATTHTITSEGETAISGNMNIEQQNFKAREFTVNGNSSRIGALAMVSTWVHEPFVYTDGLRRGTWGGTLPATNTCEDWKDGGNWTDTATLRKYTTGTWTWREDVDKWTKHYVLFPGFKVTFYSAMNGDGTVLETVSNTGVTPLAKVLPDAAHWRVLSFRLEPI